MGFKHEPDTDFKRPEALSAKEAKAQVQALRKAIEYHDYLYYVKNRPEISDHTYDILFARLQELEETWPDLQSSDSPTQKVGAPPVDRLEKRKHTAPMLSLDAVRNQAQVAKFHDTMAHHISSEKNWYVLEPKFDGLSVEVVYRNGSLEFGATRGDGETGEDITENLKTIGALPLRLRKNKHTPSFLAVRAEVIMPMAGFQALNRNRVENGKDPFAMPEKCPVCGAGIFQEGAYHFCPGGLACRARLEGTVIQSSKKAGLDRFLYALGIRHVGRHMAQVLARNFSSLEKLQQASGSDLQKIPQVGPRVAGGTGNFQHQQPDRLPGAWRKSRQQTGRG